MHQGGLQPQHADECSLRHGLHWEPWSIHNYNHSPAHEALVCAYQLNDHVFKLARRICLYTTPHLWDGPVTIVIMHMPAPPLCQESGAGLNQTQSRSDAGTQACSGFLFTTS
jgi:hypothetical protein